jgi:hypothetical protein
MATRFRKDVLSPGRYRLGDGRTVEYTRQDIYEMARNARSMIRHLDLPVCDEHQDSAKPRRRRRRLSGEGTPDLGLIAGVNVLPGDVLAFDIDATDDEAADRLMELRWVSPEITQNYRDELGHVWPGHTITHIAATDVPVRRRQSPFQRLSAGVVRLSLADRFSEGEGDMHLIKGFRGILDSVKHWGIKVPAELFDVQSMAEGNALRDKIVAAVCDALGIPNEYEDYPAQHASEAQLSRARRQHRIAQLSHQAAAHLGMMAGPPPAPLPLTQAETDATVRAIDRMLGRR